MTERQYKQRKEICTTEEKTEPQIINGQMTTRWNGMEKDKEKNYLPFSSV
jgi:hypothetical protein